MDTALAFSAFVREQRPPWRQRALGSYVGRAFVHPLHLLAFGGLVAASLWATSLVPALVGAPVLEALVLGFVPNWSAFRGRVDSERRRRERAERERRRSDLLARMTMEHRDMVMLLERLLAALRVRLGDDEQCMAGRLEIEDLIDRYALLAVLYEEALHGIIESPLALGAHADELDDAQPSRRQPKVSEQRVDVMRRRLACRRANELRLSVVAEQLETIAELVKLAHERTLFSVDVATTDALIGDTLEELEATGALLDSLLAARSTAT